MESRSLLLLFFTCFVLVKCETCVQPKITNNGKTLDRYHNMLIGKSQKLLCSLDGNSVADYTLSCEGEPDKTATQAVDVGLTITPTQVKTVKCVCTASKTGCEAKNTTVSLNYLYEITVGPNISSSNQLVYALCPGSPDLYNIYCELQTNMDPAPSMNLTYGVTGLLMPVKTVSSASSIRYTFQIDLQDIGSYQSAFCIAKADGVGEIGYADFSIATIKPPSRPILMVNSQKITGDFFKASMEDYYWIRCQWYPDARPGVSETQLACGSQNVATTDLVANLEITKQRASENVTCTCSATHESNCVNATTFTVMLPSSATFPELSVLVSVMAAFVALWAQP